MIQWDKWWGDGSYSCWPVEEGFKGNVRKWGRHWGASYGPTFLGKFKTLKRAKSWIEEVAPMIDAGEGWESGPESERGPDWFGNDGIDYREAA